MSTMKIVLLLVAAFIFVHAEEAKKEDEQADPRKMVRKVYYSKQVVVQSKPVVTHYTTTHVVHGGSVHVSGGSHTVTKVTGGSMTKIGGSVHVSGGSHTVTKVTGGSMTKIGGFTGAYASFRQANFKKNVAQRVNGYRLANGNFIFLWKNAPYFKMVLTTNTGKYIKDGYVKFPGKTWKNPATWTNHSPKFYTIVGFHGIRGAAAAPACKVELFQHINYRGVKTTYTKSGGVKRNDEMSSLKVGGGCCVIIYEHYGYKGRSRKVCKSTKWIGKGWNDIVSSIKIVKGDEEEEEFDENDVEEEDEEEEDEEEDEEQDEEEDEDEDEPEPMEE